MFNHLRFWIGAALLAIGWAWSLSAQEVGAPPPAGQTPSLAERIDQLDREGKLATLQEGFPGEDSVSLAVLDDLVRRVKDQVRAEHWDESRRWADAALAFAVARWGAEHWRAKEAGYDRRRIDRIANLSENDREVYFRGEDAAEQLHESFACPRFEPVYRHAQLASAALHGRELLGEDEPLIADALVLTSRASQSRREQSKEPCERALEIYRAAFGESHPAFASVWSEMARVAAAAKEWPTAVQLRLQAAELWQKTYGPESPQREAEIRRLAKTWQEYADHLNRENRAKEALAETEKRRAYLQSGGEEFAELLAEALGEEASLLADSGRSSEALVRRREAVETLTKKFGAAHWQVAEARASLDQTQRFAQLSPPELRRLIAAADKHAEASRLQTADAAGLERAVQLLTEALPVFQQIYGNKQKATDAAVFLLARTYSSLGKVDEAERWYRVSLQSRTQLYGADHPLTAFTMDNLAAVLGDAGRPDEADPLVRQSLEVLKRQLDESDEDLAISYRISAAHWHGKGDYAQSAPLWERYIELARPLYGPESESVLLGKLRLSEAWFETGQPQRAEPMLRDVLASLDWFRLDAKTLGATRRRLVLVLSERAQQQENDEEFEQAAATLKELIQVAEDMRPLGFSYRLIEGQMQPEEAEYTPSPIAVGEAHARLARIYARRGDVFSSRTARKAAWENSERDQGWKVALEQQRELAEFYQQAAKLGNETFNLLAAVMLPLEAAAILESIAERYLAEQEYEEAVRCQRDVLKIKSQILDEDNPDLAARRLWIAHVEKVLELPPADREKLRQAQRLLDRAAEMREKGYALLASLTLETAAEMRQEVLGEQHVLTSIALKDLGEAQGESGDAAAAEKTFRRLAAFLETELGDDHPQLANCRFWLAEQLIQQDQWTEAEPLLQKAWDDYCRQNNGYRTEAARVERRLAEVQTHLGKHDLAEPHWTAAASFESEEDDVTAAWLASQRAEALDAGRRFDLAEPIHLQAVETLQKTLGEEHEAVYRCRCRLVAHYRAAGKPEAAKELLTEALLKSASDHASQGDADSLAVLHTAWQLNASAEAEEARWESLLRYARAAAASKDAAQRAAALKAVDTALEAPPPEEETHRRLRWAALRLIDREAARLREQSSFAEAQSHLERAVSLAQAADGEGSPAHAEALESLAESAAAQGRFEEAAKQVEAALAMRRRDEAWPKWKIAEQEVRSRQWQARASLPEERRVELSRADERYDEAMRHYQEARFSQALAGCQAALEQRRAILGERDLDTAQALALQGLVLSELARYEEAQAALQAALKTRQALLGEKHPLCGITEVQLGRNGLLQGQIHDMTGPLEHALEVFNESLGVGHPDTMIARSWLGRCYFDAGQFNLAAETANPDARSPEWEDVDFEGESFNAIGYQSDWLLSADLSTAFRRLGTAVSGVNHRLNELASSGKKHSPDFAQALFALGQLHRAAGDLTLAESIHRRSLAMLLEFVEDDHPAVAAVYQALGATALDRARPDEAEAWFSKAAAIRQARLPQGHPLQWETLQEQAFLQAATGRTAEAAQTFDALRRSRFDYTHQTLAGLAPAAQLRYLFHYDRPSLEEAVSLALAHPEDSKLAAQAAEWLMNGKGVRVELFAAEAAPVRAAGAEALVLELQQVRRDLVRLLRENRRLPGVEFDELRSGRGDLSPELLALVRREEAMLATLRAKAPQEGREWLSLEQVRRAIPPGTVLIDCMRIAPTVFRLEPREEQPLTLPATVRMSNGSYAEVQTADGRSSQQGGTHIVSHSRGPAQYVAWIIPPWGERSVQIVSLGDAATLDAAMERFTEAMAQSRETLREKTDAQAEAEMRELLQPLADQLLGPLRLLLSADEHWLVCPDEQLMALPWAVLPIEEGKYLLEERSITYVNHARDVDRVDGPTSDGVGLIVGNPDFDATSSATQGENSPVQPGAVILAGADVARGDPAAGAWAPLPGAAEEIDRIRPHLEQFCKRAPQVAVGKEATRSQVLAAQAPRVLVICTHAYSNPESPLFSSRLYENEAHVFSDYDVTANPLLSCGLVFAGANQAADPADTGLLTALEAAGIDLRGTELVVLSGCATGRGQVELGSLSGLRQVFALAGAQTVVDTLWQISDRQTAALMEDFWKRLAAGEPRAEALRSAQRAWIEASRQDRGAAHPYYWAPFVVNGRWQ